MGGQSAGTRKHGKNCFRVSVCPPTARTEWMLLGIELSNGRNNREGREKQRCSAASLGPLDQLDPPEPLRLLTVRLIVVRLDVAVRRELQVDRQDDSVAVRRVDREARLVAR